MSTATTHEFEALPRLQPIAPEDLPKALWWTRVPIRFGQCDAAGIVYTPNYFDMFNGVIEDWYKAALGLDYYKLMSERRLAMGYGQAACEFFVPNRMGDVLDVTVVIGRIGRSSVTLTLHAMRGNREVVRGRFVSVATNVDEGAVVVLPEDVRQAFERYRDAG